MVGRARVAQTWYPVSDHPTDKATYGFEITVLKGKTAVAKRSATPADHRGRLDHVVLGRARRAGQLPDDGSVGNFTLRASKTRRGLPVVNAVDEDLTAANAATTKDSLAKQPDMIAFFEDTFTRYLFNSFGAIVDDDSVDYALETQTKAGLLGGGRRGHRRA